MEGSVDAATMLARHRKNAPCDSLTRGAARPPMWKTGLRGRFSSGEKGKPTREAHPFQCPALRARGANRSRAAPYTEPDNAGWEKPRRNGLSWGRKLSGPAACSPFRAYHTLIPHWLRANRLLR